MTVTVLLITYNHAPYIRGALDSVLAQRDCEFEVVVIDDCSTDGTREILLEYQARDPSRISLVLAPVNQHNTQAWMRAILAARGRYIALLDGDDFWTSPDKLRIQAAFLDAHDDCAICFHNVRTFNQSAPDNSWPSNPPSQPPFSTIDDLWRGNFMETCSVMFRAGLFGAFPRWFDDVVTSADWALHLLNARHGRIGYIDQTLAAYRRHGGGVWTRLSRARQVLRVIDFYERMDERFAFAYHKQIEAGLHEYGGELLTAFRAAVQRGDWAEAARAYAGLLRHFPEHLITSVRPARAPVSLRRYPLMPRLIAALGRRPGSTRPSETDGAIDTATADHIAGWAWDFARPDDPVTIEVREAERVLIRGRADLFRRDLLKGGAGNGYHAFWLPLPASCRDGRAHRVDVVVAGAGVGLRGSPVVVSDQGERATGPDADARQS